MPRWHVGVGEDDVGLAAVPGALGGRSVAVVGGEPDAAQGWSRQRLKRPQLILGQGLGGEKIERVDALVGDDGLQHRDVVDEGLATGGSRRHDHVLPGADGVDGPGLVRVEPGRSVGPHRRDQGRRQRRIQSSVASAAGRQPLQVDDLAPVAGLALQFFDHVANVQLPGAHGGYCTTKAHAA